ncbi:MAG: hypothetical protein ABEL97_04060 [Salinibacter sp.]
MSSPQPRWCPLALLLGLLLLGGCDSTVDPFAEETGVASVYGVLTLSEAPSFIRVKNLNDPLVGDSTRMLDATVTLTNRETGATETLTDSVVAFDGVYTHNFRTDLDLQERTTYRITVQSPAGRVHATATLPESTRVDVRPEGSVSCTQQVQIAFQNVSEPRLVRAEVGVPWRNDIHWVDLETSQTGSVPIGRVTPSAALRRVVPESVLLSVGQPAEYCSVLFGPLRIAYTHFGPDWPPDSVVADPFASQVENGLGVFGGIHRDTVYKPTTVPSTDGDPQGDRAAPIPD